jgi:hypothetical protein
MTGSSPHGGLLAAQAHGCTSFLQEWGTFPTGFVASLGSLLKVRN